ncbi:threonine--tRNA ligase [Mesoplasma chauliocola]|uniref:Threonine--tRNA ligase n=1 Tax=Mesoplasma chauliocola TaxID=216427 RepID=A0A249SML9_9MOLU|nr:threonine--tRNA ligase [Mesoplasma chauliocola]ASZ08934.1 threonine--tRNA ligase [Mesoplasma chauliocola]
MKIKLLDGSIKEFDQAMNIKSIAEAIAISLKKATIAAKVNGRYVSVDHVIEKDSTLELITSRHDDFYKVVNYTAAFVTGVAISELYKDVKLAKVLYKEDELEYGITFEVSPRIGLEELQAIQNKVNQIIKNDSILVKNVDLKEAEEIFATSEYQKYLAKEMFETYGSVSIYTLNNTSIVSKHPIALNLKAIKIIEVQQLTGEYWLNDSENIMLQKVHGMAADSIDALNNKKEILEDRRSRDHRIINKTLKIFGFDHLVGPGLPLWMPNGTIVKEEIKKYLKEKEWEYDFINVTTPVIGTVELYKKSGHWDHYGEDMFQPFNGGSGSDEQFILRPMNCPHHVAVYKQEQRSYRDLPLRIAEHALQHRYESSGSLTGLERVRAMELTDSHIFVRPDQVEEEFKSIYKMINEVLQTFNIQIDYLSLSLRDPEDKVKYYQDDKMWDEAEAALEKVLQDLNIDYKKCIGEAAFYGPKLDIQIKTAQNHEITVSTIQLDFLLPKKFDVTYIDQNQEFKTPIMIHRGLIGTYERFIATLLEQTKGVLPLWLAPNQIQIIPVGSQENNEYANEIRKLFKKDFIRTHVDLRDERLSYKIRDAQTSKIPYQLVIGDQERKDKSVTYRKYGSEEQITIKLQEFKNMILDIICNKK